jgi:MFS family permease
MITQIYNYLKNKDEDLASGLIFGLAFGLFSGLIFGLIFGLAFGLFSGLFSSLFYGLAFGLFSSLFYGLAFGLFSSLTYGLVSSLVVLIINIKEVLQIELKSILIIIFLVIALTEIIFWFVDKSKPKKENRFWFTIKRKLDAFFSSLLILGIVGQIYLLGKAGIKYITKDAFLKLVGYIGAGIIALAIIGLILCLFIKINELKYKK